MQTQEDLLSATGALASAAPQQSLPLWPDHVRGMPNPFLRSSLFRVGDKRARREYQEDIEIASIGNFTMLYRGIELRQDDADVLMQIFHLSRTQPIDVPIVFTRYQMVKELGWSINSVSYQRLRNCLMRLAAALLVVKFPVGGFSGRLIDRFVWLNDATGEEDKTWSVWLDPKILFLFQSDKYSWVEWEPRLKMGELAKWAQGYYASHSQPFPIKIETVLAACGSSQSDRSSFKRDLKKATDILIEEKQIDAAVYEGNLVIVGRASTKR